MRIETRLKQLEEKMTNCPACAQRDRELPFVLVRRPGLSFSLPGVIAAADNAHSLIWSEQPETWRARHEQDPIKAKEY
jgi:hypothetical protein